MDWKAMVEKDNGFQVNQLRRDSEVEYISNRLRDFCAQEGIVPHTPQHNGTSERLNRALLQRVRSMLHSA